MGLLLVLIIWILLFAIVAAVFVCPSVLIGSFYQKRKHVKVSLKSCALAPGIFIFSFACLFGFENMVYAIISGSDIGIGEDMYVEVGDAYELRMSVSPYWELYNKGAGENISQEADRSMPIQELLVHDETIAITSKHTDSVGSAYYVLSQLNAHKAKFADVDSASTTKVLWSRYTKAHNLDMDDVYTCDEYYFRYRRYFSVFFLVFDIVLYVLLLRKYGRRIFLKEESVQY